MRSLRANITLGVLFSFFSTAAVTQADSTPYAWWRFNETAGTTAIDSAGHMHATLVNGAAWTNGGLYFDGVDDYVALPDVLNGLTNGFTISLWVKPEFGFPFYALYDLVNFGNGFRNDNVALSITSSSILFESNHGDTVDLISVGNVVEGRAWQMVTVSLDSAGNACIYKNAQLVKTGVLPVPRNIVRSANHVAKPAYASYPFYTGCMRDLIIFDQALSAQSIPQIYNAQLPPVVTEVWVDDDYYAGGFNDGRQWKDTAFDNLPEAVNAALPGATIHIAAGTYGHWNQSISLKNGHKLLGAGAEVTIIDGTVNPANANGGFSILDCTNCDASTVIDGITIRNAGSTQWTNHFGAAMTNTNSYVTVTNCVFESNIAIGGGAVYNNTGNPQFKNCRFVGNRSGYYGGAAVYNKYGSPRFENCAFEGNSVIVAGGAVHNYSCSPTFLSCMFTNNVTTGSGGAIAGQCFEIADCTFVGNRAGLGGALYGVNATVKKCSFIDNEVNSRGGAICNSTGNIIGCSFVGNKANKGGAVSECSFIQNCTFINNTATAEGGGIYGGPSIIACIFADNIAVYGGGFYGGGSAPILDCVFEGNTASSQGGGAYLSGRQSFDNCIFRANQSVDGGGVYVRNYSAGPIFRNCTLVGNTAQGYGGALFNNNDWPVLSNCILSGNMAVTGSEIFNWDTSLVNVAALRHCIVSACGGSGAGWDASLGTDAGGNLQSDPLFTDASGGDLRLSAGSPAIDAGDNTAALQAADLDGRLRKLDGNCDGLATVDIGAYEYQAVAGDVNDDCAVDLYDLTDMSDMWLQEDCTPCGGADLNLDHKVDLHDLEALAREWLAVN